MPTELSSAGRWMTGTIRLYVGWSLELTYDCLQRRVLVSAIRCRTLRFGIHGADKACKNTGLE